MNSHQEISYENYAPKSMLSQKEISHRPTKKAKILRKICSTKHEVAQGLGKKRRPRSFTVNARKEGERTLIKIPWPAKKANSNFMHNQLPTLASSQHIPHHPPPPSLSPELTL